MTAPTLTDDEIRELMLYATKGIPDEAKSDIRRCARVVADESARRAYAAGVAAASVYAERYRYARAKVYCSGGRFQIMLPSCGLMGSGRKDLPQQLDAAIDAARAKDG